MIRPALFVLLALGLACDDAAPPPAEPPAPAPTPEPAAEPTPEPAAPPDTNEACARVVVSSWQGAAHAAPTITRSKEEARARADALRARVEAGEGIAAVAAAESDAPSSRARGGAIGTFARTEWPEMHGALEGPIFGVTVGSRTEVVEAPYGYVFAERCPIEKVHTRHLLIRYEGARNADDDITRSRDAARQLAAELREAALGGRDFEEIAREHSEDGSAERGGDLGPVGRGLLQPPFEEAAFALSPGGLSDVVETVYGFHVIQRVE